MRKSAQIVNKCTAPPPQSKEEADLRLIRAVMSDKRLSEGQVLAALLRITAPYVGESVEVAQ